ncbi:MAG: iron-containing alcohol dehydrogenase, partial [Eubacteriales bacterium]
TSDLISKKPVRALPLIAVPTTSGTGSEADPTGVVTLEGGKIKKSFGAPCTYPKVSFFDPRYTESLNIYYTESTALDALCHCIESYLSPKSTEISRLFAADGAAKLYRALEMMSDIPHDGSMDEETVLTLLKPLRYADVRRVRGRHRDQPHRNRLQPPARIQPDALSRCAARTRLRNVHG